MKTKLGQFIKNYFPIYFSVLALIVACSSRSTGPDNEFDASVLEPMLTSLKPKVYFDESHNGQHTLSNTYQAFAKLVENDGCEVKSSNRAINNETLSDVNLYVTVAAKDDHGDASPYSDEEINTLESWVNGGGSALIVTEHYPFGKAMSALLAKFGVEVHNGYTEDSLLENKDVIGALLFEKSKGNLNATHPILNQVEKINTFTGTSVKGDSTWIPLITFSPSGQNYNVKVNVIKDGGDVRTNIEYADFYSTKGYAQAICKQYGKGRIVVLAEAGFITAQIDRNGDKFGMNVPDRDNKQFVLNMVRWLVNKN